MIEFLQTIAAFILALGILVAVHEFGHYWVAKKLGVKILRFSLGFGRAMWTRQHGETEFVVAAIPLGGYVKMLDEREAEVAPHEQHRAFNRQSLLTRIAVVVAGPLANFVLAFAAYWLVMVIGVSGPRPIIGEVSPDSVAARAGLQSGDEIIEIAGLRTQTWDGVFRKALPAILDGRTVAMTAVRVSGSEKLTALDLSAISVDDIGEGDFLKVIGITPKRPHIPPRLGRIVEGGAAAAAGLRAGDLILSANGTAVASWGDWVRQVRANPERELKTTIERAGVELEVSLVPAAMTHKGETIGRIGAEVKVPDDLPPTPIGIERYGALGAGYGAVERTWEMSLTTLKFLGQMISGRASVQNLSGPISIAHYAGASAKMGTARFLEFLALVSVSLGVLNLLPIPLLDGGHLLYYLIEFISRRPVPESVQIYGQQIGLVMLLSLMGLAVYNDILRIL